MRLPAAEQTTRPWRIHALTSDFRLEDVWALPTPGGPDDFGRLVELLATLDPIANGAGVVRLLFTARRKAGEVLRLDGPRSGTWTSTPTLRDRLPADLRITAGRPLFDALPATPLYLTHDEFAAEIVNRTVHGVLHLSWVPDGSGGYRGQLAVYVKRNGLLGTAYMALIDPFRYWLVYPSMLREIGRTWRAATRPSPTGAAA